MELDNLSATGVRVLRTDTRVLVSAARNAGASKALGKYLLFLDDDNVIASDSITPLVKCLDENPDVSIVGPVTYYADDPTRIWCAGISRSRILGRTRFRTRLPIPAPAMLPSDDYPNCFMMRARDFVAIGGFDEGLFPMHYEEADLAARLREANFGSPVCVTASSVWHSARLRLTGRLRLYDPDRAYVSARARCLFTARHEGAVAWALYVLVGQFVVGTTYIATALMTSGDARWLIIRSYLRGASNGVRIGMQLRKQRRRAATDH
jgi:GT2 family glycosyltransferase